MPDIQREHAIVIGGSVAGLLAASVLSEAYDRVTIVDRDDLPGGAEPRAGVPQGRHVHGLLPRGVQAIEELLPGFTGDLVAAGAPCGDAVRDSRYYFNGRLMPRTESGLLALGPSRPMLEGLLRARIRSRPTVSMLPRYDVTGLLTNADQSRITGVRLRDRSNSGEMALNADLVVDASGRSSRIPEWLANVGYPQPAEERVPIDLGYTTCRYRFGPDAIGGSIVIVRGCTPAEPRGVVVQVLEDGQALVSLIGVLGDYPPTDKAGFRQFAAKLPLPEVQRVLREAEPVGTPVGFRFAASVRRHYERMTRFPGGLLVLGDALCSFNPAYAQGMSVAALQALALRAELRQGGEPQFRRYFRAVGRVIDVPWQMAIGGDLAFAGVPGKRTLASKLLNRYLVRLHSAVARDPALGIAFIRVAFLLDSPPVLLRPDRALRVLLRGRRPAA